MRRNLVDKSSLKNVVSLINLTYSILAFAFHLRRPLNLYCALFQRGIDSTSANADTLFQINFELTSCSSKQLTRVNCFNK